MSFKSSVKGKKINANSLKEKASIYGRKKAASGRVSEVESDGIKELLLI